MKSFPIVLFLLFNQILFAQNGKLIPYRKGNLWGYSDLTGKVVIEPAFERTWLFSGDNLARVKKKGLIGYIDPTGKIKIPPQFSDASDFYLGSARVEKNKKKFCINLQGTDDECNSENEDAIFHAEGSEFSGFTVLKDSLGTKLIIHSTKDTVDEIFDEVKLVNRYFFPQVNEYAIVRKKDKYGAYNHQGRRIIPVEFKQIDILDVNSYKAIKDKLWGVNSFLGQEIIAFEYDSIFKATETLFREEQLERNDYYIVSKQGKFGILGNANQLVLALEYDSISVSKPCTCPIEYVVNKSGQAGISDRAGKLTVPLKYKAIQPFQSSDITPVTTLTGKDGYINRNGIEYFSE
jgi:hypothetical protein